MAERYQMTEDYGLLLKRRHALPASTANPAGIVWSEFCTQAFGAWKTKPSPKLSKVLQKNGIRFFKTHGESIAQTQGVILHGDLAPINLMVRRDLSGCTITGMIDFSNTMRGDPWFDLTAATVLLQLGDREIVQTFLNAYSPDSGTSSSLRTRLMVNTMIHPLADPGAVLNLIEGAEKCQTWDEVALKFWPL